jgi:hypothetical protein
MAIFTEILTQRGEPPYLTLPISRGWAVPRGWALPQGTTVIMGDFMIWANIEYLEGGHIGRCGYYDPRLSKIKKKSVACSSGYTHFFWSIFFSVKFFFGQFFLGQIILKSIFLDKIFRSIFLDIFLGQIFLGQFFFEVKLFLKSNIFEVKCFKCTKIDLAKPSQT